MIKNYKVESILPFTLEVLPSDDVLISDENIDIIDDSVADTMIPDDPTVKISVNVDNSSYVHGDKVEIIGQIQNYDLSGMLGNNLVYEIVSPQNKILNQGQFAPDSNGSFSFSTFAMDNFWPIDGNYLFKINFQGIKSEVLFFYNNTQYVLFRNFFCS